MCATRLAIGATARDCDVHVHAKVHFRGRFAQRVNDAHAESTMLATTSDVVDDGLGFDLD